MENIKDMAHKIKQYSDVLGEIVAQDIKHLLDEEFEDVTARQSLLLEMLFEKTKTVTEIAEELTLTPSAVSQLIGKLEKAGYVKREVNLYNRREILVSLDEKGKRYHDMVAKLDLFIIENYYLRLNREDIANLLDIYEKLIAIVSKKHSK